MVADLAGDMEEAIPTIREFAGTFAQTLVPALRDFGGAVLNVMRVFNQLSPAQREQVIRYMAIGTAVAAIGGPILLLAGIALPALTTSMGILTRSMLLATRALMAFRLSNLMMLTPLGRAARIIGALGVAVAGLFGYRIVREQADELRSLLDIDKEILNIKEDEKDLTDEIKDAEKERVKVKERMNKQQEEYNRLLADTISLGKKEKVSLSLLDKAIQENNSLIALKERAGALDVRQLALLRWSQDMIRRARVEYEGLVALQAAGGAMTEAQVSRMQRLEMYLGVVREEALGFASALDAASVPAGDLTNRVAELVRRAREYMNTIQPPEEKPEEAPFVPLSRAAAVERYGQQIGDAFYNAYWGIRQESVSTEAAVSTGFSAMAASGLRAAARMGDAIESRLDSLKQKMMEIDSFAWPNFYGNITAGMGDPLRGVANELRGIKQLIKDINGSRMTIHAEVRRASPSIFDRGVS